MSFQINIQKITEIRKLMKRNLKCIYSKLCAAICQDFGHFKNRLKAHTIENSCQNKFGLFDQFTWQKRSEGS